LEYAKILIIIRRSNGDVFLTTPLIKSLKKRYPDSTIDLLVNKNTESVAKILPFINNIYTFDYNWKKRGILKHLKNEFRLISNIYKKYDLTINLTSNDRNVLYAYLAGRESISTIEQEFIKSWWKKIVLSKYFYHDKSKHIVEHNLTPLKLLNIKVNNIKVDIDLKKLKQIDINRFNIKKPFIIFHPSSQHSYKIYPVCLRNILLEKLNSLNIPIVITGGKNKIDLEISKTIPNLKNIYNLIGKTSILEYIALNNEAMAYIGMDTLNMHIAAALNKQIFAIFGPTLPHRWSPWCNSLECYTKKNLPIQKYGNITIFQADMPCVSCGQAGCNNNFKKSDCLYKIAPETIFYEVKKWLNK